MSSISSDKSGGRDACEEHPDSLNLVRSRVYGMDKRRQWPCVSHHLPSSNDLRRDLLAYYCCITHSLLAHSNLSSLGKCCSEEPQYLDSDLVAFVPS